MPIASHILSKDYWIKYREPFGKQSNTIEYIDKFNSSVEKLKFKYDGILLYYDTACFRKNVSGSGILEYTESSPFSNLFKLSPYGYFLNNFIPPDLWKRSHVDYDIKTKFTKNLSKYPQPVELFGIQHEYILFILQSTALHEPFSFDISKFFDIIKWATQNKKHIYFKLHPFTSEDSHILKIWQKLKDNGFITEYTVLVDKHYNLDHLIDNCSAVWSFNSGVAFTSIFKRKPVVRFYHDTDYAALTTFADSPDRATLAKLPSDDDLLRYLTWYHNKLTIDMASDDFEYKLEERFEQVFKYNLSLEQIF